MSFGFATGAITWIEGLNSLNGTDSNFYLFDRRKHSMRVYAIQWRRMPTGLKIAAIYLILSACIGLGFPLLEIGPHHPEFEAKSIAYKLGSYTREILTNLIFLISGIGLFYLKSWARKLALAIILFSTVYATSHFAWGMADGKPGRDVYITSFIIVGFWNSIWFYLIYRKSASDVMC